MRKLCATAVLIIAFVAAFYITVTAATGSIACENDTGAKAYGLRVIFDQAVAITRMGSAFANWTTQESYSVILFWNGSMYPSGRFSFFWEPKEANVLSYEWLPQLPAFAHFQKGNTRQLRHLVTKPASELRYNRIGTMCPLYDHEESEDWIVNTMDRLGLMRNKYYIDPADWPEVGVLCGYSTYHVTPSQDKLVDSLNERNIKTKLGLVYWHEGIQEGIERQGKTYSRFTTEEEVQDYLDYVRFLVQHFAGRVEYYEILNEPDVGWDTAPQDRGQYVDVEDYIKLASCAIPIIREEDPQAKVVVGAVSNTAWEFQQEYLFRILRSDLMPLVDGISWHPMYGASPAIPDYRDYYYAYPALVQRIKRVASSHGFRGEYMGEELVYRTPLNPQPFGCEPWEFTPIVAAKYYARGILVHLGLAVATDVGGELLFDIAPIVIAVQTLCTVMAGHEAIEIPVEVDIHYEPIAHYGFKLPNGDKLFAIWADGVAQDEDPGVPATITFPGLTVDKVTGIDVLHGFEQELAFKVVNESTVVRDLLVKDYPILIRLSGVTESENYQ